MNIPGEWQEMPYAQTEKKLHEEDWTYSAILGRTVIRCKSCHALKGSKEWEYSCRGVGHGAKSETPVT